MQKGNVIYAIIIIIAIALILGAGGYFSYQHYFSQGKQVVCTMEAKICPDGSSVGRTGPNCDFALCPVGIVYKNDEYSFEITLLNSWEGYSIAKQVWEGHVLDNYQQTYSGPEIIIKNPKTTPTQQWQDIPIMIFTPNVWQLILEEKLAVSAAPIGPAKIGENSKYIFATPPRWYGFTDAIGFEEAVEIVKTFKAF